MSKVAKQIPEGWKVKIISELCQILSGSTPKTSENKYWDGTIPWFTPLDLSKIDNRYVKKSFRLITEDGFKACSAQKIPPYSLIMSSRAPIGYFAINLEEATTNQGCKTFVCSKEVNVDFLYYYLNCYIDKIKRLGSGSTFAEVNKKQLESLEVVVPPLPEQTKIAAILSKVDSEIGKVDRIIEQTEKLKKGLMQKLLTKGVGHTKFKQSDLGEIPEEWEVSNLESVSEMVIDCKNRTPKYFDDGTHFVVRTPNVRSGKLILDSMLRTDKDHYSEWTKRGVPKLSDLLITREAPAGEFCLVPENLNICLGQRMMLARANCKIVTPQFLLYWFQCPIMQKYISSVATGSTVAHLRVGQIKELCVVVPPLYEQKKIASILGRIDDKFEHYQSLKYHLVFLKKGLMNDLLSGRVKVHIS